MNPRIEEYEALLTSVQAPQERIKTLCELAYLYRNNNAKRARVLLQEAERLAAAPETSTHALGNLAEIEYVSGVIACCAGDYEASLEHLTEALESFQRCNYQHGEAKTLRWLGITHIRSQMYTTALEYLNQCHALASSENDAILIAQAENNIGDVHFGLDDYKTALTYYRTALKTFETIPENDVESQEQRSIVLYSIASAYKETKEYSRAMIYFRQSLAIRKQLGDTVGIGATISGIADVLCRQGKFSEALELRFSVLDTALAEDYPIGIAWSYHGIGEVYTQSGRYEKALEYFHHAEEIVQNASWTSNFLELSLYQLLSQTYKLSGNSERALHYFERYHALREESAKQDAKQSLRFLQRSFEIDKARKEAEIYRLKNVELVRANAQNEELLLNILPTSIANRLKQGATRIADKFEEVTVLFADIVGFTNFSSRTTPEMLVGGLDVMFSMLDELAQYYGLEKIKTIGDAYMVVGGVPERRNDHCQAVARFALDVVHRLQNKDQNAEWLGALASRTGTDWSAFLNEFPLHLRIGIHTGEAVAGIIGKKKFSYDLWGDTVNTASRMESHGEPGKIHISSQVFERLSLSDPEHREFCFEQRGALEIKGKGLMTTYFLLAAPRR
jgi:class 3 adenylate cyclase